jgi:hypothetical protein
MSWRSLARYTVYRTAGRLNFGPVIKTILHFDQPYEQAILLAHAAEALMHTESGYRPHVMSRALICIELEKPEETRIAYRALLHARATAISLSDVV